MGALNKLLLAVIGSVAFVACGGGGGGAGPNPPANPPASTANNAPTVAILATGPIGNKAGSADLTGIVGSRISLSGASSTDPDGDLLTFSWSITSRPSTSTVELGSPNTAIVEVVPDALGAYTFTLRVTDARGASADRSITIEIDNTPPAPAVLISATFFAEPTVRPTQIVSVGARILLNASSSTDVDGDPVTISWTLIERPAGSSATIAFDPTSAQFATDIAGIYRVAARAQDPLGAYSETVYVLDAQNDAPNAILVSTVTPAPRNNGASTVQASVGYIVSLDSAGSSDPDGGAITRDWQLVSRPNGSAASLSSGSAIATQITPDVLGSYVVRLTVNDASGAAAVYTTTIQVANTRPNASIDTNSTPIALPSGPAVRIPVGTQLTLRGSGSVDADGGALTYGWAVLSRPTASVAALSSTSSVNVTFTPDVAGSYSVRLRVTDSAGAYSERTIAVDTGNYPPVAVINKNRVSVILGSAVTASASLSFDEDGDALAYSWAIDARPSGSTSTIAAPTSATLSFTPDVAGTYVASVTVSDGQAQHVGYVTIRALSNVSGSVELPFVPLEAHYSQGLDRVIILTANPNAIRIVDPFVGSFQAVSLPVAVKAIDISPDGRLAAVLHEGLVSLVDLATAQLVMTSATLGSHTDVFLQNDSVAYLIGHSGQWADNPITVMNIRTGVHLAVPINLTPGSARFYGTQLGVFAHKKNKVLFMAMGLSPADISSFNVDPVTHAIVGAGESPYHGDYSMGSTFYLSGSHDLLFTSAGTYFNSETLRYAGTLNVGQIQSMAHSTEADEALVLLPGGSSQIYPYTQSYSAAYKQFRGALLLPDEDLSLPTIAGLQSYGIQIFHSANNSHVLIVQTGSAEPLHPNARYHIIYR